MRCLVLPAASRYVICVTRGLTELEVSMNILQQLFLKDEYRSVRRIGRLGDSIDGMAFYLFELCRHSMFVCLHFIVQFCLMFYLISDLGSLPNLKARCQLSVCICRL